MSVLPTIPLLQITITSRFQLPLTPYKPFPDPHRQSRLQRRGWGKSPSHRHRDTAKSQLKFMVDLQLKVADIKIKDLLTINC